ncbi:hypothetical protein [Stutzerimonas stutzeri]|uniref:hypothetical protein n=1 Tax=Stutzerimonas stutzeri TaxID=316 RepID=UPI00265872ED|nr:hypothetical protein [Stutzerimonas stutzeri]MCF6780932.1 hypothetical protein [Stutzerimonas stutzeri]MCF6803501.1 hypothetical protein [Stutzerimonas stutzeri]
MPTPPELEEIGGAFIGRSLVNPGLNRSGSRPLLLGGELFRVFRVRATSNNRIQTTLRHIDPATGEMGPSIELVTEAKTAAQIGQGEDQPDMEDWDGGYRWEGMDITPDGRSHLIGLVAAEPYSNQLVGLLRFDIGGTAEEPTAALSVVMDREAALGESTRGYSSVGVRQILPAPAPVEIIEGPCGTARRTLNGELIEHPDDSARAFEVGTRTRTDTVTGRLLTAWFTEAGEVHIETFSATKELETVFEWHDRSEGQQVTEFHYSEGCQGQGSTVTGEVTYVMEQKRTRIERSTVNIGGIVTELVFTQSSVLQSSNLGFTWDYVGLLPWSANFSPFGVSFSGELLRSSISPVSPHAPTDRALPILINFSTAPTVPGWGIRPQWCGWKGVGMAAIGYDGPAGTTRVMLTPVITPSGIDEASFDFTVPATQDLSSSLAGNGAYNPITGEAVRGWPNTIVGCI